MSEPKEVQLPHGAIGEVRVLAELSETPPMTMQQAAQRALQVQDACNLSGVVCSFYRVVQGALWPEAIRTKQGSAFVAKHAITTLFLLKLSELNGCGCTLHETYEPAERECMRLAGESVDNS